MRQARAYFEDLALGTAQETPAITVTQAHVGLYLGLSGEPPEENLAVPSVLPLCLSIGLGWRAPRAPLAVLAFMGLDWQVLRPLRVGDTVSSRSRVVTMRPMREGGIVVEERDIVDQRGEVVQKGRFTFLVARRPPEEGSHGC